MVDLMQRGWTDEEIVAFLVQSGMDAGFARLHVAAARGEPVRDLFPANVPREPVDVPDEETPDQMK